MKIFTCLQKCTTCVFSVQTLAQTMCGLHLSAQWTACRLVQCISCAARPCACGPHCASVGTRSSHNHEPCCPAADGGCILMTQVASRTHVSINLSTQSLALFTVISNRVRTIPRKAPNTQYPIILASSDTNTQYQCRY